MPSLLNSDESAIRTVTPSIPIETVPIGTYLDNLKKRTVERHPIEQPLYRALVCEIDESENKVELLRIIWKLVNSPKKFVTFIYLLTKIIGGLMFKDWKTTVTALIGLIAYAVKILFNIEVSADVQAAFILVTMFIIALFTKDSTKKEE